MDFDSMINFRFTALRIKNAKTLLKTMQESMECF